MREYLFRAKRIDSNEWVYGSLFIDKGWGIPKYFIIENDLQNHDMTLIAVIPETVGQDTGLTDKNGTKIFDGDFVKFPNIPLEDMNDSDCDNFDCIDVIAYSNILTSYIVGDMDCTLYEIKNECEVIGNIHDNPELFAVVG